MTGRCAVGGVIPPGARTAQPVELTPAAPRSAREAQHSVLSPATVRALGAPRAFDLGYSTARPLVFVDTETTGLHPGRRAWEIALVKRALGGVELRYLLQVFEADLHLAQAERQALEVSRFHSRHWEYRDGRRARPLSQQTWLDAGGGIGPASMVARVVEEVTRGCTLVGANVAFDAETLSAMLRGQNLLPAWHYRMVDVEALAAGHLHAPLQGLEGTARAMGVQVDSAVLHTALGDALLARDVFDAVYAATS